MKAIRVPIWLSLGFFGLVFQNNVADMGSTPRHMCMAQAPFQREPGVGAGRAVGVRTEEAKQGLSHIFNFLSFLQSTGAVPVLLSGTWSYCLGVITSVNLFSKLSSKGLSVI